MSMNITTARFRGMRGGYVQKWTFYERNAFVLSIILYPGGFPAARGKDTNAQTENVRK